ncbi:MAG: SidE phosphodiesterase domain-containing protein [Coxiellaceae bacterium]|nr:SidE phosphodiesterase domain-containing protein [Coxiellaceae bacterium]
MRTLDFSETTHPLLDTTQACLTNTGKAHNPFRTTRRWLSRTKAQRFHNIRIQYDGDLVRAQALFTGNTRPARHELMTMAAVLIAQHRHLKLNKQPLAIPCSGKSMTSAYHLQASELLEYNVAELKEAYNHYREKLARENTANTLNKIKQIQQMLAGALFLQQQYQLMQPNDTGHKVMTMAGYEQAELASRQIAKHYCSAGLNAPGSQPGLHQAAWHGNIEQLRILLANPATNINQTDISGRTALYIAAQHNQLEAVKLLITKGAKYSQATATQDSALTVALLNGHHDVVRYLSSCTVDETQQGKNLIPLHQGPTKKNLALRHVEYIFHCLLDVDFVSYPDEDDHYAPKNDGAGRPLTFRLEKTEFDFIIAHCKNGQSYNLSLALKHANLCYFQLTESAHDRDIIKRCETLLGYTNEAKLAKDLKSSIGGGAESIPCYQAEKSAIWKYTGSLHTAMNALLRGTPTSDSVADIRNNFVISLLAISGANKNIHAERFGERAHLTRGERSLPVDIFTRMQTAGQIIRRSGLLSFTSEASSRREENRLQIISNHQWQGSVAHFSQYKSESEVLFPPSHLRFIDYNRGSIHRGNHFNTQLVRGVCTDYLDDYHTTKAMQQALDILKKPYKNSPDPWCGIARHNHALAHHIRASFLIEPTINYFKQHAAEEDFKTFCDSLQPNEVIIMKVMMIFSKTGRESEVSPIGSGHAQYMLYQQASADNLSRFMRDVMHCDEATIAFYAEIMLHMGNPNYPSLVTGANEEEKQRKLYINHITALAHKLDLPRVYGRSQYDNTMSGYNGTRQKTTDALFIQPSREQKNSLRKLESIALSCIVATGDNLCFSMHGIEAVNYSEDLFKQANTDVDHCVQQCVVASTKALQQHGDSKMLVEKFKLALRDHKIHEALRLLTQFPAHQLFKHQGVQPSAFKILLAAGDEITPVFDAICQLAAHSPHDLAKGLHVALKKNNVTYALQLIQQLPTEMLNMKVEKQSALIAALRYSSDPESVNALLAKGVDVNENYIYCNEAVITACKYRREHALQKILQHASFKLSTMNRAPGNITLKTILRDNTPRSMIVLLLNHGLTIQLEDIIYAVTHPDPNVKILLIESISQKNLWLQNSERRHKFVSTLLDWINTHKYRQTAHNIPPTLHALSIRGFDLYYTTCNTTALGSAIDRQKNGLSTCQYLITNAPPGYLEKTIGSQKQTALLHAVSVGNIVATDILLMNGANINAVDCDGNTALILAFKQKNKAACELLLPYYKADDFIRIHKGGESAISIANSSPELYQLGIEMMKKCLLTQLDICDFLHCFDKDHSLLLQYDLVDHFGSEAIVNLLQKNFSDAITSDTLAERYTPHIKRLLLRLSKNSNTLVLTAMRTMLTETQSYLSIELQFALLRGIVTQNIMLSHPDNAALHGKVKYVMDTLCTTLSKLPGNYEMLIDYLSNPATLEEILTKIEHSGLLAFDPEKRIKLQNIINEVIPGSYAEGDTSLQVSDFDESTWATTWNIFRSDWGEVILRQAIDDHTYHEFKP